MFGIIIATLLPIAIYFVVGLSPKSRAKTVTDYFIYSQAVTAKDYANTSVGYALQMAAMFLFAFWAILYGVGALWTAIFWCLGFALLYLLLPKFVDFHGQPTTLHEYLAKQFNAGHPLQIAAAAATIFGLWGTMMAEVDYTVQVYAPVLKGEFQLWSLGAVFLLFGVSYIVMNGYKAEVRTERLQVPLAYSGFILTLLVVLPRVRIASGPRAYTVVSVILAATFVAMLVAKLQMDWRRPLSDPQALIPALGLIGLFLINRWLSTQSPTVPTHAPTVLDLPIATQLKAQGAVGLFSLFIANVLWMPVDLSTWQRIASVEGEGAQLMARLRKGTVRVLIESPASWCLGVALGLIIETSGLLGNRPRETAAPDGIMLFSSALADGSATSHFPALRGAIYPIFVAATVAIMLSTVDSIVSAIAYTAYQDLPPYKDKASIAHARQWTVAIMLAGLVIYPLLRVWIGANLPTFLYAAYSSQLALFPLVFCVLMSRNCDSRAAYWGIFGGILATGAATFLAVRISDPDAAVLPPIFAFFGATIGYVLGFRRQRAIKA